MCLCREDPAGRLRLMAHGLPGCGVCCCFIDGLLLMCPAFTAVSPVHSLFRTCCVDVTLLHKCQLTTWDNPSSFVLITLSNVYTWYIYIPGTRYWNTIITAIIILSTYVWVLHYCHVRSTTHKVYDTMIDRRDLAYEYSCYYEILILILLIRTGIK